MAVFDFGIDQGSYAWQKLRSGIPTASEFGSIITPARMELSKSRWKYACRLVAQRLLNWQPDSLDKIQHIADGKANEPAAVAQLGFVTDTESIPVGFVRTDDLRFGASPDRISGPIGQPVTSVNTVLEVKCPTIPVQFERLLLGHGDDYKPQVMGQLFVAEAEEAIFYSYHERTPAYMVRTHRDEAFIRRLTEALEQFSDELEELTEQAKTLGTYQAFAEVVTALDAARGPETEKQLADFIEGEAGNKLSWGA
jgi:hypothetical protein